MTKLHPSQFILQLDNKSDFVYELEGLSPMSKINRHTPQMNYFKEEDVLYLLISEEVEAGSIEISPNVTAELNVDGELIGVEILNAKARWLQAGLAGDFLLHPNISGGSAHSY